MLPGSSAGLISETFAGTGFCNAGNRKRSRSAKRKLLGLHLPNVHLGNQRRRIHHREQGRACCRGLPSKQRPVGDNAGDRTANLRVAQLSLRRPDSLPFAESRFP